MTRLETDRSNNDVTEETDLFAEAPQIIARLRREIAKFKSKKTQFQLVSGACIILFLVLLINQVYREMYGRYWAKHEARLHQVALERANECYQMYNTTENYSDDEIKRKWRRQALIYHPDVCHACLI